MIELISIIALAVFLTVREYLQFQERHDMLDRLMAKNLPEYKDNTQSEPNDFQPSDLGLEDVEQAQEAITNGPDEEE